MKQTAYQALPTSPESDVDVESKTLAAQCGEPVSMSRWIVWTFYLLCTLSVVFAVMTLLGTLSAVRFDLIALPRPDIQVGLPPAAKTGSTQMM